MSDQTDIEYDDMGADLEAFPAPPRRRWIYVVLTLLVVFVLALTVGGLWVKGRLDPPGPPGDEVVLEIPKGASTSRIAGLLEDEGIIRDSLVFRAYVRVVSEGPFQAGRYTFRLNSSVTDAIKVLDGGPSVAVARLTIPEGFTLEQIAERVGRIPGRTAAAFLEVAASGKVRSQFQPDEVTSLEGFLYPDTYALNADTDDEERILRRMVERFDSVTTELGFEEAESRLGRRAYDVVIVASMIEREARVSAERPKVARVVYNRLESGIALGIDATTRYELKKPTGPLLRSELQRDSPYNTRTRKGLPPTPISNPGRAALQAALNPEPGPWIYYVIADEEGRHTFVVTDREFQRAKAEAQRKGLI
jgi:UPF0755 protein